MTRPRPPGAPPAQRPEPSWLVQVLLLAALLQLFAPAFASRMVLAAASDPLVSTPLCSGASNGEPGGQHSLGSACLLCSTCCQVQPLSPESGSATVPVPREHTARTARRMLAGAPRGPLRLRPRSRSPPART